MITEKQKEMLGSGILFHFLDSDRSKLDSVQKWLETLDHSQASPIIGKLISLKHDVKLTGGEWAALEEEVRQDLISLGMPFIQ